jgi:hypothetical protein
MPTSDPPGAAIEFPQNGPSNGVITRLNSSEFILPTAGIYEVQFQVSVTEPGQLVIALHSGVSYAELKYTTVGRATGTSQIVGLCLVQTSASPSRISIWNPTGNSPALTLTPLAGGTQRVSAHLVIKQLL